MSRTCQASQGLNTVKDQRFSCLASEYLGWTVDGRTYGEVLQLPCIMLVTGVINERQNSGPHV